MPKRCAVTHEHVNSYTHPIPQWQGKTRLEPFQKKRECAMCRAKAKRAQTKNDYASEGDNAKRLLNEDGERPTQTWSCCNKCMVHLCSEACFDEWDHERNAPPLVCEEVA